MPARLSPVPVLRPIPERRARRPASAPTPAPAGLRAPRMRRRGGKGGRRISFGCAGAGVRTENGVIAPLQDGRGGGPEVKDMRRPPFRNVRTLTMNSDTGEPLARWRPPRDSSPRWPPGPCSRGSAVSAKDSAERCQARPVLARIRALDEAPVTTTPWPGGSDTPPRLAGHHCPLGARRAPDADTLALRPIPRDPDRGPIRPRPRVPRRLRRSAAPDGRDPDRGIRARDPRPSKPPSPPTEGAP